MVWEGFGGTPWRYLNPDGLRAFLIDRVREGYVFSLNPKWLLCDAGWMDVYAALASTAHGRRAIAGWWPDYLRERVEALHARYPAGFERVGDAAALAEPTAPMDMDLMQLQLKRYMALRRARLKLRVVFLFLRLARKAQAARVPHDGEGIAVDGNGVASAEVEDDLEPDLPPVPAPPAEPIEPDFEPEWPPEPAPPAGGMRREAEGRRDEPSDAELHRGGSRKSKTLTWKDAGTEGDGGLLTAANGGATGAHAATVQPPTLRAAPRPALRTPTPLQPLDDDAHLRA